MKQNSMTRGLTWMAAGIAFMQIQGCSSIPEVKTEAYASLKDEKTYENEFPDVWKAIEESLRNTRIVDRDPSEVSTVEMRRLDRRTLDTDWIFSKSKSKYQEYTVNDFPRKTFLQNRFKYHVDTNKVMGGVKVKVTTIEEVERLKSDGTSAGYQEVGKPDPVLASDLIEKINQKILSAAP